tara:strand:- start:376 stop:516 length:141 start_codon:yes stop_codon:yes gene_type:complete
MIELEKYTITDRNDGALWIEMLNGEGMQVSKEAFERIVAEFYKDIF